MIYVCVCFRLREKKTDFWNLSQKSWNALFAYMCGVKHPIFMHYLFCLTIPFDEQNNKID